LIARLADLSCGDLAPREMRESKRHLVRCQSCAAYRRSYRATVELARQAYRVPGGAEETELPEALIGGILAAARTRLSGLSPRAWHLVHLLSGIAAGPLIAFYLRS
jgi:anti-sigma factor RsiW